MKRCNVLSHLLILLVASVPSVGALAQGPPPPPPPLGPPPAPPGNPVTVAKANLGKALFWDEQMSSAGTVACGTCHVPGAGGSDPRSATAGALHPGPDGLRGTPDDIQGSPGVSLRNASDRYEWESLYGIQPQVTSRRGMTMINAAYAPVLFWDGRATGEFRDPVSGDVVLPAGGALESQAAGPPLSTVEMGHLTRDWPAVAQRIGASRPLALSPQVPDALATWIADRNYPQLFQEAFGSADVSPARIAMAIATYERTLFSDQTPFDAELGGTPSLTQQERQGMNIFRANNCGVCHGGNLLTDNQFHYTGIRPQTDDLGRFAITGQAGHRGQMRTPTLRNVSLRAPFFHNGRFATLRSVVDFYDRGGDFDAPNKAPAVVPLGLTEQEKQALVAFLSRPLVDPRVAAELPPFDRPALYSTSDRVPTILQPADGTAGSGGLLPAVVALEPPLAGNRHFAVGLHNAMGGASATLVIADQMPPDDSLPPEDTVRFRETVTLAGFGEGAGYGTAVIPLPDTDPALIGLPLFGRWYVEDTAVASGHATSPAFRLVIFGEAIATPQHGNLWMLF